MAQRSRRWLLIIALAFAVVAALFGLLAWLAYRHHQGATTPNVLAVVSLAVSVGTGIGSQFGQPIFSQYLAELRSQAARRASDEWRLEAADVVARAVAVEWRRAAAERALLAPAAIRVKWVRATVAVAGPISGAIRGPRVAQFDPLPGLPATTAQRLRAGRLDDLHAVYGGLGSGRLIIVGSRGAGKTSAAMLLVLSALEYRDKIAAEDRARVPVPVMFTLGGWNPRGERLAAWLRARLAESYGLFKGRHGVADVESLLRAGALTLVLDGLDDAPEEQRPVILQALNEQASCRVILLSRSAEMVAAASQAHFADAAAVELQPLDAQLAADYLRRVQVDPPPSGWQSVVDGLRNAPDGPLARALNSPLAVSLIRDTYRAGDDLHELLDVVDRAADTEAAQAALEMHLLGRVIPAAYRERLGEPRSAYDAATAERALRRIAERMTQDGVRDLRWWRIPTWVRRAPRACACGVVAGVAAATVIGLGGPYHRADVAVALGLLAAVMFGSALGGGLLEPRTGSGLELRVIARRDFVVETAVTSVFLLPILTLITVATGKISAAVGGGVSVNTGQFVVVVVAASLAAAPLLAAVILPSPPVPVEASSLTPPAVWRADLKAWVTTGLVAGGVLGILMGALLDVSRGVLAGLVGDRLPDPVLRLALGMAGGILFGGTFGLLVADAWTSSLAFAQLARVWGTPARLLRFLEDARRRGVLRTVGPLYQFRHARLQDYLSAPPMPAAAPEPAVLDPHSGGISA